MCQAQWQEESNGNDLGHSFVAPENPIPGVVSQLNSVYWGRRISTSVGGVVTYVILNLRTIPFNWFYVEDKTYWQKSHYKNFEKKILEKKNFGKKIFWKNIDIKIII